MFFRAIAALSLALGLAFLVIATYFYRATRAQDGNLESLSLPVSLVPGIVKTPEFRTDFASDYDIAVDWDAKVSKPRTGPMIIDISWEVLDGAKIAAEGNSQETWGVLDGGREAHRVVQGEQGPLVHVDSAREP